jgi:hypothetical protein
MRCERNSVIEGIVQSTSPDSIPSFDALGLGEIIIHEIAAKLFFRFLFSLFRQTRIFFSKEKFKCGICADYRHYGFLKQKIKGIKNGKRMKVQVEPGILLRRAKKRGVRAGRLFKAFN